MNGELNHWRWNRILGFSLLSLYLGKSIHYVQQLLLNDTFEVQLAFAFAALGFITLIVYYVSAFRATLILILLLPIYILFVAVETAFLGGVIKWAYLPEHALQITLPLLFLKNALSSLSRSTFLKVLIYASALTFFGHGILASGFFHEVPGNFLEMTSGFFRYSHQTSVTILLIWGILDFIVIAMLFIAPLRKYGLLYMFLWGTLTAAARVIAYWDVGLMDALLFKSGGTLFRLLHGLVPLYLFLNRKQIKL